MIYNIINMTSQKAKVKLHRIIKVEHRYNIFALCNTGGPENEDE